VERSSRSFFFCMPKTGLLQAQFYFFERRWKIKKTLMVDPSKCTGCRTTVTAKSPMGSPPGFGDSNMGGHWGPELKYAGYDQLVIQGKASRPVYLWIENDRVEIRDASHLLGKQVPEADALIKEELNNPEIHVALIGPAGENLVRYACIMNDVYRAAGRSGMGAVMGSKNLKAVAVRGTNPVQLARPEEFFEVCARARERLKQDIMAQMLYDQGTWMLTMPANYEQGWFCWHNFQQGFHPQAKLLSGENHRDNFLAHREGCFACSISCGRFSKIPKGKYAGEITGGPEYETLTAIGPRMGFGEILAEGSHRAARHFGRGEDYTMTVKGHDISQDDPRGLGFAFGIGFATGRRGGDHLQGLPCLELTGGLYPGLVEEILGTSQAEDRLSPVKKPEMEKYHEDLKAVGDSLTQCAFTHSWSFAVLLKDMAQQLSTATGLDYEPEELLKTGGRIVHLERAYWNRLLVGRLEDKNPKRFTQEPMPGGPNKGTVFPEDELIPRYYQVRGWDAETGFPLPETLKEYRLEDVLEELEPYRRQYLEKVQEG